MKSLKFFFLAVFAGMMFASCEKTDPQPNTNNSLVGKWAFVDLDGVTLEITDSVIMFMPVVPNPVPYRILPYKWLGNDSIEIEYINWGGEMVDYFTTRNKVIFHTKDSVTIKYWFYGQNEVDVPIYKDVTLVRIGETNSQIPAGTYSGTYTLTMLPYDGSQTITSYGSVKFEGNSYEFSFNDAVNDTTYIGSGIYDVVDDSFINFYTITNQNLLNGNYSYTFDGTHCIFGKRIGEWTEQFDLTKQN